MAEECEFSRRRLCVAELTCGFKRRRKNRAESQHSREENKLGCVPVSSPSQRTSDFPQRAVSSGRTGVTVAASPPQSGTQAAAATSRWSDNRRSAKKRETADQHHDFSDNTKTTSWWPSASLLLPFSRLNNEVPRKSISTRTKTSMAAHSQSAAHQHVSARAKLSLCVCVCVRATRLDKRSR